MLSLKGLALLALATAVAGGCAGTGFGQETRADVTARMGSIKEPLGRCYGDALTRNRRLQGSMVLAIVADHGTGKFSQVSVARSDVPDPELERCVIEQVSTLKLEKPTKTKLQVEYPLELTAVD